MAAPVPVVAFGKAESAFSATVAQSVDVGTASDRVAYVWISSQGAATTPVGVTVGADTLSNSQADFTSIVAGVCKLFYGPLTVTGAQTVTATFSDGNKKPLMVGTVYAGVGAGLLSGYAARNQFSTSYSSGAITSAVGDMVAGLTMSGRTTTNTLTETGATVELTGTTIGDGTEFKVTEEAGAASVTLDGTFGASVGYDTASFSIPAIASGSSFAGKRKLLLGVG